MRTDRAARSTSIGVGVALSGLAHAVVILTTPAAVPMPAGHVQAFVELSLDERGSNKPDVRSEAETTVVRGLPSARRAKGVGLAPRPRAARAQGPAAPFVPVAQLQKPAAPAPVNALNLLPQASSLATEACEIFDDRHPEQCGTSDRIPDVRAAEQTLNERLSAAANRPSYRNQREAPKLTPAADGGYDYTDRVYHGSVLLFRAHIALDGAVHFEDAANLQIAPIPISGTFDLTDALQGGELHTAEKRWFLEQTAELRSRLADAARAVEDRRMRSALEQALERLRASATAPKAKRDALIELWLGCGDTPKQRAMLEAWVREHMPQGSELGFTVEELATLNHGRSEVSRFEPYATALSSQ